ncbi:unnamed protein product [Lactuca saligna]|uniref:Myb/SANT-like domain-containing protein n=1 Tax=Lactuca saligna TaxID=75948 RepID=A0AA36EG83_LACSI|nr:unnamed protein product [Lactuca saligna]
MDNWALWKGWGVGFPWLIEVLTLINIIIQLERFRIVKRAAFVFSRHRKNPRGDKWDADEDIVLMSAYCIVSENERRGKNQKKTSIWAQVKELYDANQVENPGKLGNRNIAQMKGRYKRLNESAGKWDLQLDHDATRSRPEYEVDDEESGGSTKRSRFTEKGDYCVQSNIEGESIGGSTIKRPTGRDAAKRKEKGKSSNEVVAELRAMRLSRDSEVEVMKKKT